MGMLRERESAIIRDVDDLVLVIYSFGRCYS